MHQPTLVHASDVVAIKQHNNHDKTNNDNDNRDNIDNDDDNESDDVPTVVSTVDVDAPLDVLLDKYRQLYGIGSSLYARMGWRGDGPAPLTPAARPTRVGLGFGGADNPALVAINEHDPLPPLPPRAPLKADLLALCARVRVRAPTFATLPRPDGTFLCRVTLFNDVAVRGAVCRRKKLAGAREINIEEFLFLVFC